MESNEVTSRINTLINFLGLTPYGLEKHAGIPKNTIRNVVEGRNKPGYETLLKVVTNCPQINPLWLLMGEGEMLKAEKPEPSQPDTSPSRRREGDQVSTPSLPPAKKNAHADFLEGMEEPITNLYKPGDPIPKRTSYLIKNPSKSNATTPGSLFNLEGTGAKVAILEEGFASAGLGHSQEGIIADNMPTTFIPGLKKGGTYVAIRASGNSMEPTIPDGTWLVLSPYTSKQYYKHEVFVVFDKSNDSTYVKRLQKSPDEPALILISDNLAHKPFNIPYRDVGQTWKVELALQTLFPVPGPSIHPELLDSMLHDIDDLKKRIPQNPNS